MEPVYEGWCYFFLRVSSSEVVQEPVFFFSTAFLYLCLRVDHCGREKSEGDSFVGTAARRKVQLGIFALERDSLEVCGEKGREREREREVDRGAKKVEKRVDMMHRLGRGEEV